MAGEANSLNINFLIGISQNLKLFTWLCRFFATKHLNILK